MSSHIPAILLPAVQQYAWGKKQDTSLVFDLVNSSTPTLYPSDPTTDNKTFAELWMGTHPSAPSKVVVRLNPDQLSAHLATSSKTEPTSPHTLTSQSISTLQSLKDHIGTDLPFLFKVLSINEALSIQSHPDKALAKKLHKEQPESYKDDNHKPELVVALSPMRILRGFRALPQIIDLFKEINIFNSLFSPILISQFQLPPLDQIDSATHISLLPDSTQQSILKSLWSAFHTFNTDNPTEVSAIITTFQNNYQKLRNVYSSSLTTPLTTPLADLESIILPLTFELSTLYPTDIAIFSPLFLHYFALKPGESTFLGPNIPHAYLYGDCVEIMASSDNVIRAGLTPKYRDVPTLLSSLTYEMTPSPVMLNGVILNDDCGIVSSTLFQPPQSFPEFALIQTKIAPPVDPSTSKPDEMLTTLPKLSGDSLILLLEGHLDLLITVPKFNANTSQHTPQTVLDEFEQFHQNSVPCHVNKGDVLFIPANAHISLKTSTHCSLFQAVKNIPLAEIVHMNDFQIDKD